MIKKLLNYLENNIPNKKIYIQAHNFPDQDAMSSAFGLQTLLKIKGYSSEIVYDGVLQRYSLLKMMNELKIEAYNIADLEITSDSLIIHVDSTCGQSNVTKLPGTSIAVIDHHQVSDPGGVPFVDIRSNYGSCSTIIGTYFKDLNIEPSIEAATALKIGLSIDTAMLTRGVNHQDLEIFNWLFNSANNTLVDRILRNNLRLSDLKYFNLLLNKINIYKKLYYCYFPDGCEKNLLGILGDFALSLDEIETVVLMAKNENEINISVRNEMPNKNANELVQHVLKDIGSGGGHENLAAGVIWDADKFDEDMFHKKVISYIYNTADQPVQIH